jgi:hypothetical protein
MKAYLSKIMCCGGNERRIGIGGENILQSINLWLA